MNTRHVLASFFVLLLLISAPAWAQDVTLYNQQPETEAQPDGNDLKDVPDEYIQEALNFYDYCEATSNLNQHYDCRCLSAKYLDKKIEGGEETTRTAIMMDIVGQCPDATNAAGMRYQECLNNQLLISTDKPVEEFCECYANEYAKLYEHYAPRPSSRAYVAIETQAMITCDDPALAARIYPQLRK